jgi:hypothetical protein
MYANESGTKYAAVVQDWKMQRQTETFTLADTQRKTPANVMGYFFGNVTIKGRPYLITPTDFVVPKYYNLIMGYDLQRSIDQDIIKDINVGDLLARVRQLAEEEQKEEEERIKLQKKKKTQQTQSQSQR